VRQPAPKRSRDLSLLQLIPNLLTIGAICAGLTAIRFAVQGSFQFAVALIVLAAVLDGLDGRLARLLKTSSELGAELDSLADFLNFGVAPPLIIYFWALQDARSAGWIAVLIFAVCCVMRLARFNVGSRAPDGGEKTGFIGVPSPAAGLLVLLPLYLARLDPLLAPPALVTGLWLVFVGFLMIGRFPTPSLKGARVGRETVRFVVLGFVALVAFLATYPWATLTACATLYLGLLARDGLMRRIARRKEE
jgi:CDP-diacylglycerol---serine O-phosphatidyltransferase